MGGGKRRNKAGGRRGLKGVYYRNQQSGEIKRGGGGRGKGRRGKGGWGGGGGQVEKQGRREEGSEGGVLSEPTVR